MNHQTFLLLVVLAMLLGIAVSIENLNAKSQPEIKTEYKTITETVIETEYIKINQTEPMEMLTTAYTAGYESTGKRPGDKGYGVTFTGTKARVGVCATDPKFIPLGSALYVEEYGFCISEDVGGAVKGWHVDVFMESVSEALKFGREKRKVWILSNFGEEDSIASNNT